MFDPIKPVQTVAFNGAIPSQLPKNTVIRFDEDLYLKVKDHQWALMFAGNDEWRLIFDTPKAHRESYEVKMLYPDLELILSDEYFTEFEIIAIPFEGVCPEIVSGGPCEARNPEHEVHFRNSEKLNGDVYLRSVNLDVGGMGNISIGKGDDIK